MGFLTGGTLCPSATIGSQAECGPPTAPLPGVFRVSQPRPYDVGARTSTVLAGGPHFAWVSDSRMNIEAHEHNPQLPAERSGQRLLLGTLHVCSRTSPPRKVLGERRRNGVTGRLGIIPKESSFSPTPFYFRACLGRSDAAIQCPAFQLLVVAGSIGDSG